jgi:uncharacterized membrane protein YqaE (UPF0057 family)
MYFRNKIDDMKNVKLFFGGVVAMMLVSSCGIMNDGFSGSSVQKRKYTKGFYLSKHKSWSKTDESAKSENVDERNLGTEVLVNDQAVVLKPETNSQVLNDRIQEPTVKKNDRTEQTEDQKSTQKKDETKKVITSSEKKNAPVQSKQRKERVPERYLPIKKEAIENKLSHQSHSADDFQILCIILTILIPFVGVAVYTNLDVKKTLICLLLTLLFYFPGLIYGLLVVLDKI